MQGYKQYLKTIGLSPSTIKGYLWHLDKFLNWLGQEKPTEKKLQEYFQYLLNRYHKISTINLRLIILNSYLKFLGKKFRFDLLSDQPKQMLILTPEQVQKFLANPEKNKNIIGLRDKALLELLYSSGLKVGQLVKLRLSQIDELKKEIILSQQKINITPLVWFHIKKYISQRDDDKDWIFISYDRSQKAIANHLTVRSVERIIKKYAKGLNPPLNINPQILRNTLAHYLKTEGANSQQIKNALHFKTSPGASNYLKRL